MLMQKNKINSNKIKALVAVALFIPAISYADEYKKNWTDKTGKHEVVITIDNAEQQTINSAEITAYEKVDGKISWKLHDYVHECAEKMVFAFIPESFEIKTLLADKNKTTLFAYKIGCNGGITEPTVKYFAYHNGKKYALRGVGKNISEYGTDNESNEPKAGVNLKSNETLYQYMSNNWTKLAEK